MDDSQSPAAQDARKFHELVAQSPALAAASARAAHPADIVAWLADLNAEDAWQVFANLSTEMRASVLEYADDRLRERIVPRLTTLDLVRIVDELPADEAVDVLAVADDRVSEDVLGALEAERAQELRELRTWPEASAAGVMTSEYLALPKGTRLGDAIKVIKASSAALEGLGVFVLDELGRPIGYLADRDLLTHSIHTPVEEVMTAPVTIRAEEHQKEAAARIAKYGLSVLAVVDEQGILIGAIAADDAQAIAERAVSADILRIVGTQPAHQPTRLTIAHRVRRRLPVMLVTVAGGLVTAAVLDYFLTPATTGGSGAAAILRYLPIVIGLAGNVGIQSATILVRAFATGEVEPERELAVLLAEVSIGLALGLICGSATAAMAGLLEQGEPWLGTTHAMLFGAVLGGAVALAVTWAAFLGCVIPMCCRRLRIDPATVAGPFLISLSDISGSAIYIASASTALARLLA